MRDDFFKTGYSVIKNIDKTTDALYQRKPEADGMLQIVIKQIMLFSQLLADENIENKAELLHGWAQSNSNLMDAIEQSDIILTADVLHHEVRPLIKEFVD